MVVNRGMKMGAIGLGLAGSAAALLCACATPEELKRPVGHPVMAPPSGPDPLPAYLTPRPESAADQP